MNTKTILPIAIMLSLPLMANAANISGDMYTAPAAADTNHPAPTTNVPAPYGRANIDTTDQEHIATTAYVKGAYNSAIAAVNKVNNEKVSFDTFESTMQGFDDHIGLIQGDIQNIQENKVDAEYVGGAIDNIATSIYDSLDSLGGYLNSKRVTIYTTWNDDSANATTKVTLSTAD